MRPRHADTLKTFGFEGEVNEFRSALLAVKNEHFAGLTDEELTFGKDSSARFCVLVRERLGCPRLGRVFLLRALIGLRKNKRARKKLEAAHSA